MPPRRGRGRRGGRVTQNNANTPNRDPPSNGNVVAQKSEVLKVEDADLGEEEILTPLQVKVSNMPDIYNAEDFKKYLSDRLKMVIPKIISKGVNHPFVVLELKDEEDKEKLLKALEGHVWRTKKLLVTVFTAEDKKRKLEVTDGETAVKKLKPADPFEAIMDQTLPLLKTPYEEQNRLSVQDAELLAKRLHASLCSKNSTLLGWAEASCEANSGFIYKIEPLKVCQNIQGYKNKCKFRIGKNSDGETTVGFVLNENSNKILGVEPGDKFIHMPESMKYAAKMFQDYLRKDGSIPYDKQKKMGVWDNLLIRVAPDGALMIVAIVSDKELDDAGIARIKEEMNAFFETGDGKDCNVFSLYLQIFQEQHPNYPLDKLTLLMGKPDYEENICGLKFYVSPFSILNINPSCSENIYNSVIELAEPAPDSVVIDVCAGSCGIAFTFANKVEKCYAIERKEENIKDALKTKELNNIENVEIIKGKCEDHLEALFKTLKDKPLIVVLDPPRHGVVSQTVAQIRQQPNVKKIIYVCSNSKTSIKNFVDFSAKEGREQGSGLFLQGLPFLPVRAIPIDVAPFTVNNSVVLLLERIDPTTYPPAKNPAPELPAELPRRRNVHRLGLKRQGKPKVNYPAPSYQHGKRGDLSGNRPRGSPRPLMGSTGWMPSSRPSTSTSRNNYIDPSILFNKYERRIAELEQRDRAFRAGLSMGMQVSNRGFAPPENNSDYVMNNHSNPWQSNNDLQFNNYNPLGFGSHATNTHSLAAPSGYGAHAAAFGGPSMTSGNHFSNHQDSNQSNFINHRSSRGFRQQQSRGNRQPRRDRNNRGRGYYN